MAYYHATVDKVTAIRIMRPDEWQNFTLTRWNQILFFITLICHSYLFRIQTYLPNFSALRRSEIVSIWAWSVDVDVDTAHTRGLSTNVPNSWTFLPFALPTMNASVTVIARSTSPKKGGREISYWRRKKNRHSIFSIFLHKYRRVCIKFKVTQVIWKECY